MAACGSSSSGTDAKPDASVQPDASAQPDASSTTDAGDASPPVDAGPSAPVLGCAAPGTPTPTSPLAAMPSAPGAHIAAIEALGDDEWLKLPEPAPDPEFGLAHGRAWGGRAFVYAPRLRGALFTGEGNHAFVKSDGYAGDDLWFYDIPQNRWVAVYPGLHLASFNECVRSGGIKIDAHGQVTNGNDQLIPVHTLIHAWDFLSYDSARHRFVWLAGSGLGRYFLPGLDQIEEGVALLEQQRDAVEMTPMSPWYYDIASNTFGRDPLTAQVDSVGGYSAFTYIPEQDVYLDVGASGVRSFDPKTQAWTRVTTHGTGPTGYDHGVAYDTRRQQLYMGPGSDGAMMGTFVYDIATSTWSRPNQDGGPQSFGTNHASAIYDPTHDVITLFHYTDRLIYTYDPNTDRWSSSAMPAEVSVSYPSYHAFYDPDLNAYFVYVATDSATNGDMWAYRHRR